MGFTDKNVNRNILPFTLKDLYAFFLGETVFVINAYMLIEFESFPNGQPSCFFLNYLKKVSCINLAALLILSCEFHCYLWHCVKVVVLFDGIQVCIFIFAHLSLSYVDIS